MAHIQPRHLAELWRAGQEFPPLTEPRAAGGFGSVLQYCPSYQAQLVNGGDFIRFLCPDCQSVMFHSNTDRGIRHAAKVAAVHKPGCCAARQRQFRGTPSAWPDD